jgi:serine acetyltransferase
VVLGVGASVLGPVHVGAGAEIGAHCLVVTDVPAGARLRAPTAEPLLTDQLNHARRRAGSAQEYSI